MSVATYTLCRHCDHFVEALEDGTSGQDRESYSDTQDRESYTDEGAEFGHLEDGEQEFNHDAEPSEDTHTLSEWKRLRPDLFRKYSDGKIGPNSAHHSRRGKVDV